MEDVLTVLRQAEPAARADGRRVVGAAGSGDAGRRRMMDRRNFLSTIGLGVLAAPRAADAQSATKAGRIAVVVPAARQNSFMEDFFVSLREAGYIEGRNLAVDRRFMAGRENEYDQVMAELEQQHVDVIFAAGPPAALAARRVVKEAVPGVDRLAALWSSTDPVLLSLLRELESGAQRLHVSLKAHDVRRDEDLESVFEGVEKDRSNGILIVGGPVNVIHQKRIIAFAGTHRLPSISISRNYAEDGGLMSYGPRFEDQWQTAAGYVARILKGAKPADLPVEQPTKLEPVINLKTAKALGLTIPPSLLLRADQIIE